VPHTPASTNLTGASEASGQRTAQPSPNTTGVEVEGLGGVPGKPDTPRDTTII
jgi:hypothetical protein